MKYECFISSTVTNNIPQIIIEGDMTSDANSQMKQVYTEIKSNYSVSHLILNFEQTKYINSSGIATLINIVQDLNEKNGQAYFVGMSDHFAKVMEIVGIADFVKICANLDEAFAMISS